MSGDEHWHRHLGAYGICLNDEKLLVIQKGAGPYFGRYDLPGGTVEANESLAAAVQREFLEEAGINVQVKENVGVCDYLIPYELHKRGTSHIHHISMFYLVQIVGGTPTLTPEKFEGQDSIGALWLPIKEITADNSSPLVLQVIQWLETKKLSFQFQRLDNWVVLK
ncbi:ADP-ribose pyrophosphatase YjhB (NUDIX family) [Paenibacillus endophyticus]|uniref:ADP-ribose pyrophosphatase YjhB (NUDIX family) n=1 Tax=Paenibacillus endophyticus TaxID=1294268 RepID=A0A7W5CDI8_9BACL|nr:NUDIX hydrolase [Paenibacillus endophyticus]MBB3155632.1 ADP-ribose pyrophosphatase YjhB (NUDIX family) [Paenibacillus endophyticus]